MSDQYVPALRQRFIEDMQIKGLQPKTQTMYLRGVRDFSRFLGHSPDTATPEDLRAFQLDMKERGVGAPTFNTRLTVLSFFFAATCPRPEMKAHMRYQGTAKKIPIVLSAEEVVRILEAAPGPGLKYRAAFSVAYGGGQHIAYNSCRNRHCPIRHTGFLANGIRRNRIEMIRRLLDVDPDADLKADNDQCADTNEKEQACPKCGGVMIVVETFKRGQTPKSRAPPWEDAA